MNTQEQRKDCRRKMRYYQPASRFMEGGSLYGRSRHSPHIAGRICRIFRTCIRLNFDSGSRWFLTSVNSNAYNNQTMHPLFAYELRPIGMGPSPPPPRKVLPVAVIESDIHWLKAA